MDPARRVPPPDQDPMADFVKVIGAVIVAGGGLVLLVAGIAKSQMIAVVLGVVAVALGTSRAIRKR